VIAPWPYSWRRQLGGVDGQVLAVVLLAVRQGLGVQREAGGVDNPSMPKSLSC